MQPSHIAIAVATAVTAWSSSAVADDPVRSQITATMTAPGQQAAAFAVFGTELSYGHFRIAARLPRIPCPGRYHFEAVGASLTDGTTSDYAAELDLRSLKIKGTSMTCGSALPARLRSGSAKVELTGVSRGNRDRTITLDGGGSDEDVFTGTMDISSILCPGRYRFLAAFRDRRERRIQISYRFTLLSASVDAKPVPACP
jgi:hypothetical protein